MSWCDKLAATPAIGFKLDPHFASSDSLYDAILPITNKLVRNDKPTFNIEQQDSFSISLGTDDGFTYSLDPMKASVTFKHRMMAKAVNGGPPVMELTSVAMPFTDLLPHTAERLQQVTLLLPNAKQRSVNRVGIIATAAAAEESLPPGIQKFIAYMGRPWNGMLESCQIQIVARLGENEAHSDRCIYSISKPEDPSELMRISFDWQRNFKRAQPIEKRFLEDVVRNAEKSALSYFEEIAEGSQWDEDIISAKVG